MALLLPALASLALIPGCGGGGGDDKAVTALLDKSFSNSIGSADVKLDLAVTLDGVDELQDPIKLTLTGPYASGNSKRIPSVDWDLTVSAQNQSFNANVTSTGDRAFIGFQGTNYEVSPATVANLNQQIAASRKKGDRQSLSDFGVSPRNWVEDATDEGDEQVAGVETTHVSGKLDVGSALDDLNTVVQKASKLGNQFGPQVPPQLTEDQKKQVEDVVEDPRFDAYVGKDDGKLRRLSADISFSVPDDQRDRLGGLEGGQVSFSIEFSNIGAAQPIKAPSGARPISELTDQLRGLLGGALGSAPGQPPPSGTPQPPATNPPQTAPEKRKAYEDCIKTNPNDKSVKAFCQVLLQ